MKGQYAVTMTARTPAKPLYFPKKITVFADSLLAAEPAALRDLTRLGFITKKHICTRRIA